jgi:DNA-binding transcriptional MerR regulator
MTDDAVYNIGIVTRMTGVPENTLRIWERRYQFPSSERTEGGHRLYSAREVARIQWVKLRIDEGMQTRNAIQALEQMEKNGRFPESPIPSHMMYPPVTADATTDTIRQRLYEALVSHKEEQANQILGEALGLHSLERIVLAVVAPLMTEIGDAWENGHIDIMTEHFATHFLRYHLILWMQSALPAYNVRPVIMACAPHELHEGGLLILSLLLRRLRWPVVYLGQLTVLEEMAAFIEDMNPSLVVFVAMTEESAEALSLWKQWLPEDLMVAYGGYVFVHHPKWIGRVPGIYLGKSLADGLETLDSLLREVNPLR